MTIIELIELRQWMVLNEIEASSGCSQWGSYLKVIIETALLTRREKIIACLISKRGRRHKTSTGFASAEQPLRC
jgi:deoxyribose-phosphate aldolase